MTQFRRGYAPEIRQLCIAQLQSGVGLLCVSRETGVAVTTLRGWLQSFQADQERKELLGMDVDKKLREFEKLKKEHAKVLRENERLKAQLRIEKKDNTFDIISRR